MKNLASLLGATLAVGCAGIAHEQVPDWPRLEIVEHYAPGHEIRERCARYVAYGTVPIACAQFDFDAARCHIWYRADGPLAPEVMWHERLHCEGYDHPGETTLRHMLAQHVARRRGAPVYALEPE